METQASATEFSINVLSGHYLPLNIGEYQNDLLKFDRDTMIKNNYDNTQTTRGTAQQKLKTYPLNAMLFIDGETRSMTNSVFTRSIALHMNPAYRKSKMKKPINVLGYFIANYGKIGALPEVYENYRKDLAETFATLQRSEKERIIDNYALLLGFADTMGFVHLVSEAITEQCEKQLQMIGEDNIDKIIKEVFTIAITNKMVVRVE